MLTLNKEKLSDVVGSKTGKNLSRPKRTYHLIITNYFMQIHRAGTEMLFLAPFQTGSFCVIKMETHILRRENA